MAAMVLAPVLSEDPLTVIVATPFEPDGVKGADPSDAVPRARVALPVGAAVPVAGLMVMVN